MPDEVMVSVLVEVVFSATFPKSRVEALSVTWAVPVELMTIPPQPDSIERRQRARARRKIWVLFAPALASRPRKKRMI